MARKPKSQQIDGESSVPSVASMKFWDRFKQPPPMLAFVFPESEDEEPQSLDRLMRLPNVPRNDSLVYSLRISLDDSKPSIWRRILVKSLNLQVLHQVVQVAMGWEDMHSRVRERRLTNARSRSLSCSHPKSKNSRTPTTLVTRGNTRSRLKKRYLLNRSQVIPGVSREKGLALSKTSAGSTAGHDC